ncbi:hypothetical protein LTR17_016007 [Elasticomyces elasticus]|nr:hypothetical protein LTR17_016007 [Elasticomyces elasticus]
MAAESPPAKRVKIDFSESIKVQVGASKKEFSVYRDATTSRSPFFKAAVADRWNVTGLDIAIELPDDKPEVFSNYLQCLYFDTVRHDGVSARAFCEVYILADKLGDLLSANLVITGFIKWSTAIHKIPGSSVARYVFANTPAGSQLRRMIVDYIVQEATDKMFSDVALSGDVELCSALLMEFRKLRVENTTRSVSEVFKQLVSDRPKCYYHQHGETCPPCEGS